MAKDTQPSLPEKQDGVPRHRVSDLMAGGREAVIEHDGIDYRLRITGKGKLILTK